MLNDYELLYMIKENNEYAIEELLKKYSKTIYLKCLKYCPSKVNFDEYLNEGILAFYEALEKYNEKSKFITYLNICLERKLYNYKKLNNRKKYAFLNTSFSLDEDKLCSEYFIDDTYNPEKALLSNEEYINLKKKLLNKLNSTEEIIFLLKEQNFSSKEISKIINKDISSIYRTLNNIRKKMKEIMVSL